ncbi:MAG TPA: hypothetical protein VFO30_02365, partial [Chthoniobacterales bacterium]|nr:hypothetical protein [Chthoniobacterales bacterium]
MNKAVEAGGRARRLIALGLCLPVVVITGFAIQAGTRGYGDSAVSDRTVMSGPLVGWHVVRTDSETAIEQMNANQSLAR